MRATLLLLSFLVITFSFSQTVDSYNNATSASYILVESTPAIDQSATGMGLTWNYTTFAATGVSSDVHDVPTASDLTTYPGTTTVQTTTSGTTVTKILSKDIAGEISFTGANSTDFDFNYSIDNAIIGTFPLAYGYLNTDPTAGNLSYTGIGAPFTGTITTEVDAYGTLNINDVGAGAYTGDVTRLKIIQDVSFTALTFFPGTATQTTYNYYGQPLSKKWLFPPSPAPGRGRKLQSITKEYGQLWELNQKYKQKDEYKKTYLVCFV